MILWGADAADADLDDFTDEEDKELNVLVVRGTKDAVTTAKEINDLRDSLSEDTSTFVFIPGGNNSNYANCGLVCGENLVPLCCDEQQDVAFRYSKNFLEMLSGTSSISISLYVNYFLSGSVFTDPFFPIMTFNYFISIILIMIKYYCIK